MSPEFAIWLVIAYLLGSLPWSVWLSIQATGVDPRTLADGNPGAANAFRAAGKPVGMAVLLLDFLKGFVPVAVANWSLALPESQLFWIALAPNFGHAFSIFLRLRGGRGLTTLFGVWTGLTLYEGPMVMGITALLATAVIKNDELKTILLPAVLIGYLAVTGQPAWMIGLALAQWLILIVKIGAYMFKSGGQPRMTARDDSI